MVDDINISPEEFILDILWRYYIGGEGMEKMAVDWNVSCVLVLRILKQYGDNYIAYSNEIRGIGERAMKKNSNQKRDAIKELNDEVRKVGGVITKEDMDDLIIDMGLFEKSGGSKGLDGGKEST